ncbi:metal-dependent hydrolase [Mangrovivirga sp. M17]|uniref:Metal-dependent hydrolase n=1 Tax=Mangrovivirga halotolerans TaxID=2993936 RepID=A0ABT3RWF0_9BACT|nr:metal-dependent hydrolase [Mangrovivirga halotolerans]MCX2745981.1 metal-dependent hydrolase [Mangrovivirga halotolerans]
MDSLTQALLGATVGEAVLGNKIGRKASILGALGGTLPDLDVLIQSSMSTVDGVLFHRGPSHSITFALIASMLFSWLALKLQKKTSVSYQNWFIFFFLVIFTHPLLDAFTNYGTEIFWPFLDARVAWKTIFVIDPLYSIWLLIAVVFLLFYGKTNNIRKRVAMWALVLSSSYLLLTVYHKYHVDKNVTGYLEHRNESYDRIMTVPSPLCNWLWTVVIDKGDHYEAGYFSMMIAEQDFRDVIIPKNAPADWMVNEEELRGVKHFANDWLQYKKEEGGKMIVNDIRFGPMLGWYNPESGFIFSFEFKKSENGVIVKQNDREPEGNIKEELGKLWSRIWSTDINK